MMACKGMSYDNAVYDEVSKKPGVKEFTMDKNSCYAMPSNTSSKKSSKGKSEDKKLLLVLFLVVLVLMLGTICVCVAFALEISNLKSHYPLNNTQQQDLSDAIREMNTSLLQLQMDSFDVRGLTNQLNTSLDLQFQKLQAVISSVSTKQQLNASYSALNDDFQQLINSVNSSFSVSIQQLNTSLNGQYANFQQLNTFISSINSSFSASVHQLNTSFNGQYSVLNENFQQLNSSLYGQYSAINGVIQHLNLSISAGLYENFPASSCTALFHSFPSGYYWVTASNGSAVRVYCDMTRLCGNVTGGWMRVAYLDMTDSSQQCPSGLLQRIYSGKRTCNVNSDSAACSSATFPSIVEYTKVCGRIRAYQVGSTDAFGLLGPGQDYVDGIILSHGTPRQHIWTFAAGLDEVNLNSNNCPCITTHATLPPAFVGNDYFCDTGASGEYQNGVFYGDDPLWDGAGCGPGNRCCSFNTPPWFYKQLPQPTTDNIEMSVCRNEDTSNEDVAIELVEIYIK